MKKIYRNQMFYYIAIPVLAGLWPLFAWLVYLPQAEKSWQQNIVQYDKSQEIIKSILKLDPDRLDFSASDGSREKFDYAAAIEKTASEHGIAPTRYELSSGVLIVSSGRKSQSARVDLNKVNIATFARFLAAIQLRWANLQCSSVKLTKVSGPPDVWDIDIDFKYYY